MFSLSSCPFERFFLSFECWMFLGGKGGWFGSLWVSFFFSIDILEKKPERALLLLPFVISSGETKLTVICTLTKDGDGEMGKCLIRNENQPPFCKSFTVTYCNPRLHRTWKEKKKKKGKTVYSMNPSFYYSTLFYSIHTIRLPLKKYKKSYKKLRKKRTHTNIQ